MRFSLTTLLLLAFWFATLILVWVRREPWYQASERQPVLPVPSNRSRRIAVSPDRTRIAWRNPTIFEFEIRESDERNLYGPQVLFGMFVPEQREGPHDLHKIERIQFIDDDLLVIQQPAEGDRQFVWRRRHPELWWGHFYRPEVWLALALTGVLLWRAIKARRLLRAGETVPASAEAR